ncbi:ATP-binding protein [Sphingomonas albertensis]|uniref:ATP-binding protein n=1 Tax=Sphingomonas albertensis TaxID=2762591 RepID=A0ABR7AL44_9SPHN|nr:ATP-binding protein [Sphingomonas albertensis]MBC3941184.1 ATP-binding protein [Sphingomonas albertensis]
MPQFDEATDIRLADALRSFKTIFLEYERQRAIQSRINVLLISCIGIRDVPLDGRRLSEVSQAGKSKMLTVFRDRINQSPMADGSVPNPHRVLYFELKGSQTLKMLCVMILQKLGDPHWNEGNGDDVQERVRVFLRQRGVQLLIIDEVQHLAGDSQNKMDITDELKLFLDAGIVPVVFAGNEKSKKFFERNEQLCARLGRPLELTPLSGGLAHDRVLFKTFCRDLDAAMVAKSITRASSNLSEKVALKGLLAASRGRVGRVVRIVEVAMEHAVSRDADYIEMYDLSHAIETFAMPQRYVAKNPFTP